jgi:hypothetical protein
MEKKFEQLFESVYQRYQRNGGFLVGDYVKFGDGFKSKESYKDLNDDVKQYIDDMIKSGLGMRIVNVKSYKPNANPANPQSSGFDFVVDIALDQGGGRYSDYLSICPSLLVKDDVYPNLNPLSPEREIKHKVNIKPEDLESDEEAYVNNSDVKGNGKLGFGDRKLRNKNVVLPGKPATKSMEVNSYTKEYLKSFR